MAAREPRFRHTQRFRHTHPHTHAHTHAHTHTQTQTQTHIRCMSGGEPMFKLRHAADIAETVPVWYTACYPSPTLTPSYHSYVSRDSLRCVKWHIDMCVMTWPYCSIVLLCVSRPYCSIRGHIALCEAILLYCLDTHGLLHLLPMCHGTHSHVWRDTNARRDS